MSNVVRFYSKQQIDLAIRQTIEDLAYEVEDVHRVEDEFWSNLGLTEDMENVQHSLQIEVGSVL